MIQAIKDDMKVSDVREALTDSQDVFDGQSKYSSVGDYIKASLDLSKLTDTQKTSTVDVLRRYFQEAIPAATKRYELNSLFAGDTARGLKYWKFETKKEKDWTILAHLLVLAYQQITDLNIPGANFHKFFQLR